ncbi:conserved hypothetical protein [Candidatus Caldarchaeum subterraneum]|uniref:DOD-type homing endonuclease domain-containing protein n=1 Tax=Caldiarchaeum subterraneum TaxID=311458 RepID=E6N4J4_CALS0|nr:conserved hypothetical protein [Candidatus Caldarchaeum subterraneum]BAJ50050.1 conserved hypothetical protein [Candidatus Caldarchaeum subterraneum]
MVSIVGPAVDGKGEGAKEGGRYTLRELRMEAFDLVQQLHEEGLSYTQIIDEVERRLGVKIGKSNCSYWVRRIHSPYNGIYIGSIELLQPTEDLAYLIGTEAGDAYATKTDEGTRGEKYIIGLKVKDKEFADEYATRIARVLGRDAPEPKPNKDGRWVVRIRSKVLYQLFKKPIDIDRIRPFVEYSERCVAMFLRGFFDSEGCVDKRGAMTVYNTDYQLLLYVMYLLKKLGIETTSDTPKIKTRGGTSFKDPKKGKTYHHNKDYYYLRIRMPSNETFYNWVGFTIERKKRRLEEYLRRRGRLPPANQPPIFSPMHIVKALPANAAGGI